MARGKMYNPFKAAGFKNLRQVAAKVGGSKIAKAASNQIAKSIESGGGGGGQSEVPTAVPAAFRRGGLVRKTGKATVHKGELIIPADMVRKLGITQRKKR